MRSAENEYRPDCVVVCRLVTPVNSFVAVTTARGTAAPLASVTVPAMEDVEVCAPAASTIKAISANPLTHSTDKPVSLRPHSKTQPRHIVSTLFPSPAHREIPPWLR